MDDNLPKDEYKSLGMKEFIKISSWAISFFYRFNKRDTTILIIVDLLLSVYYIGNSYILAKILDVMVAIVKNPGTTLSSMYPYIGLLTLLSLVQRVLRYIRESTDTRINEISDSFLEKSLYEKLKSLGIQTLEDPTVNNTLNRARSDLRLIFNYFFRIVDVLTSAFTLITNIIIVLSFAPVVVPLIILFSFPRYFNDKKYRNILGKLRFDTTEERRIGYSYANYITSPNSLIEILVSNAFSFMDNRFTSFVSAYVLKRITLMKSWFLKSGIYGFLIDISVYLAYLVTFGNFLKSKITVGDVFFQLSTINKLSTDLINFTSRANQLFELSIRLKDVYNAFMLKPSFPDGHVYMEKLTSGPSVEFRNLTFTYPKSEMAVLKNINITIKPGEKLAIVGKNGAGKTTLIKLLTRIYLPQDGQVLVNGINVIDLNSESLYQNIGALFQDFNTYKTLSVLDNVIVGDPDKASDFDAFINALERADAIDFVNDYPQKFNQILGEQFTGGIRPSSGQWQKIAIARFFFRNAPLVIFDEPTAAIDAESEYNIFNKIYSFFQNKTVIIISHRFSTVRNADRIIVLEKGEIIEEGTHESLMKKNGYYAKSFRLQAEGYSIAP